MINPFITFILLFSCLTLTSQTYTSYFTGNTSDLVTFPQGGSCLMGGASEDDQAMKWFLQRANGGDILVLRTSGSDGYNDYLYTDLGITVNSVETIVCNSSNASNEAYVQQKISQAEAIWFAGGDQWHYISYWRGTKIDSLINDGIQNRNIVIGGTSAGMAIQGKYYFSAENGTITSAEAISNPYRVDATVDSTKFLINPFLHDVITDTHYDSPDRKGRHIAFLARILTDYGVTGKGIACDEYTAVCIDDNGIASVYGDANYDDFAYFIQPNCELTDFTPETCIANNQLQWNRNGEALTVYKIGGNSTGSNTFDLNDWKTANGGTWEYWSINNGILSESIGLAPNCSLSLTQENLNELSFYPNPTNGIINLSNLSEKNHYSIVNIEGKVLFDNIELNHSQIDLSHLNTGIYFLKIANELQTKYLKIILE